MDKPKFRYNHKTKKWDELFTFNMNTVIITPMIKPNGMYHSFEVPFNSPIADIYRKEFNRDKS